jgi:protein O-GlcNAc transferase
MSGALQDLRDRAMRLHREGRLSEALAAHDEALALAPDVLGIRMSAAHLAHLMGLGELSLQHFEQAVRIDPRCYPAVDAARRICVGAGLAARADRYSEMAHALRPTAESLLSHKLLVPAIAESRAAIAATRARYAAAIEETLGSSIRFAEPEGALGIGGFFLAYHGENDRELQTSAARMYRRIIPSLEWSAPHCRVPRRTGSKIRIGFISRHFWTHSIFSTSRGLIDKLPRDLFEVVALRITPSQEDEATAAVRGAADSTIALDPSVYRAREQIAALELDILFFQDIGMEQSSYFLAFSRLAPVQCVSFGHPNTTGIPNMDYFVSNDLYEPPDADAHYAERLALLKDLPTLAYYYKPPVPGRALRAEDFGLSPHARLYVCPQTLYKLHPDFDALLAGILTRDPAAAIVLIRGQFQDFTRELEARFARTMPALATRIVFLPRLGFERYMQLLQLAHVVLDTIHFNGMNSSLECFAAGTPVVTLPTGLQRGRHTQAMYRKMGVEECVARDGQQYVDIAVRVASDESFAHGIRERILSSNHRLFEDGRVIEEFARFFVDAARDRCSRA